MSPLLIIILVLLVVYKFYKFTNDRPPNTPPGIIRLPFGGSYWMLLLKNYQFPHLAVEYYVKKLKSKIISGYFGDFFLVIVNDYANIKEVFTREEFDGRITVAEHIKDRAFGKSLGVFFIDGPQWHEQRRFALRHMRDFGFGRRQDKYESEMMDEMSLFIDILKNGPIYGGEKEIMKGNCVLFPDILHATLVNNIWNVMFGTRIDRSEHDILRHLCCSARMFVKGNDTTGGMIFFQPILKYFGNMFGYTNHIKGNYAMVDVIKEFLKKQKITLSEHIDRGFVDKYLKKLNENDKSEYFTEEQLIILLVDIMLPVFTGLPNVITFVVKYLMHHPKVMAKAQNEINTIVGTGRLVTWEDRKDLPYMEAIIRETMRIETLAPFGIVHKALKDTTLGGYSIPANTPIFTNLWAIHHDREMWGDPENFRPERFLKEDGQLCKDMTLPFGFGHRVCLGETYARYSMFGTLALLLQNFNFSFVEDEPSSLEDKLPGLIVNPKKLWIRLELR